MCHEEKSSSEDSSCSHQREGLCSSGGTGSGSIRLWAIGQSWPILCLRRLWKAIVEVMESRRRAEKKQSEMGRNPELLGSHTKKILDEALAPKWKNVICSFPLCPLLSYITSAPGDGLCQVGMAWATRGRTPESDLPGPTDSSPRPRTTVARGRLGGGPSARDPQSRLELVDVG